MNLLNTGKKVLLITLGCPKNDVDSDIFGGILKTYDFQLVDSSEDADIILINTCGFIELAVQESINTILEAVEIKKVKHDLKVYVWGCLSERYKQKIQEQIPEIDGFWGVEAFEEMGKFFIGSDFTCSPHNWKMRIISPYTHTAYIKIADGCNHNCTFCIIPEIKGVYHSRPLNNIKNEAQMLADRGVKELHLVAQDTTAYGKDLYKETKLVALLKELITIKGLEWIRIMYAYPASVTDDLIQIIRDEPKICSYLDIPLQHISGHILEAMGRLSNKRRIINLLKKLRSSISDLTLRTSFIIGFPGETENDFQELLDFIQEVKFDRVGCFIFSPEYGTKAYYYNNRVNKQVAVRRYNQLMETQYEISSEINRSYLNKTIRVLIDGYDEENEMYFGRSQGDALEIDQMIWIRGVLKIGEFYTVKIDKNSAYDLEGHRI